MICAYLQIRLRLDLLDECVREGLVELAADGFRPWNATRMSCSLSDTDLLKDLHGQLRRDRPARDELVKRVGEGHADATYACVSDRPCTGHIKRTMIHGRTRSTQKP